MLKEKVIKFLQDNPDFLDMEVWLEENNNACGTIGCLAGAILKAAEAPIHTDLYGFLHVDDGFDLGEWEEYERLVYTPTDLPVAAAARKLWADEYGADSAKKLPFYEENWTKDFDLITKDFIDITTKDVIKKLNELV